MQVERPILVSLKLQQLERLAGMNGTAQRIAALSNARIQRGKCGTLHDAWFSALDGYCRLAASAHTVSMLEGCTIHTQHAACRCRVGCAKRGPYRNSRRRCESRLQRTLAAFRACHSRKLQAPSAAGKKLDAVFLSPITDADINDGLQPSVVTTALSLWREHPRLPAIELLDRTMQIHAGEDLDFQFDGEIELAAPHPFAELVRQAFAPHLDATELCMAFCDMPIEDDDLRRRLSRARHRWNKALMLFAQRYRIWEP